MNIPSLFDLVLSASSLKSRAQCNFLYLPVLFTFSSQSASFPFVITLDSPALPSHIATLIILFTQTHSSAIVVLLISVNKAHLKPPFIISHEPLLQGPERLLTYYGYIQPPLHFA